MIYISHTICELLYKNEIYLVHLELLSFLYDKKKKKNEHLYFEGPRMTEAYIIGIFIVINT